MTGEGLVWAENVWAEITDEEQLDRLLDRLAHDAETEGPFVVELSLRGHGSLGVGLGAERSVITYVPEDPDGSRFVAREQRFTRTEPATERPQTFRYRGDPDDFPPEAAVDPGHAREAMRRFLRSGEVPEDVDWTVRPGPAAEG